MEHLVTIAFDFDDKTVTDRIEKTVEKAVIDKISSEVEEKLFSREWGRRTVDPKRDPLSDWTNSVVKGIFLDHKDIIIEKAAELLADSFKRTKAWKEAAVEGMECTKNL